MQLPPRERARSRQRGNTPRHGRGAHGDGALRRIEPHPLCLDAARGARPRVLLRPRVQLHGAQRHRARQGRLRALRRPRAGRRVHLRRVRHARRHRRGGVLPHGRGRAGRGQQKGRRLRRRRGGAGTARAGALRQGGGKARAGATPRPRAALGAQQPDTRPLLPPRIQARGQRGENRARARAEKPAGAVQPRHGPAGHARQGRRQPHRRHSRALRNGRPGRSQPHVARTDGSRPLRGGAALHAKAAPPLPLRRGDSAPPCDVRL
ncbi:MAG: hypothetical protein BWY35_02319 [Firmicutes bacterium ADurb.Bin248]|nr:MAG: hypothetical protein BWY35_02319 [Firmicutes bacterium ADurb.Bin248]